MGSSTGTTRTRATAETLARSAIAAVEDALGYLGNAEPLDALLELRRAADDLSRAVDLAVDQARRDGETWQAVGDALGMTRQAAQQRHARPLSGR